MGFHLEPHYFSFHSLDISTRRHHQLLLPLTISNRLFFITFLTLALLPIYGVLTVEQQQVCETKALDDVPPSPVSCLFIIALNEDLKLAEAFNF